jgi:hypothetical protein
MKLTVIPPRGSLCLPDNDQWRNRFEIHSSSSNRIYIIAENKKTGKYGCSCPAYRTRRYCKHLLQGCGLRLSDIHGNGAIENNRPGQKKLT